MELDDLARQAHFVAEGLRDCARDAVRERVSEDGKLSADASKQGKHGSLSDEVAG